MDTLLIVLLVLFLLGGGGWGYSLGAGTSDYFMPQRTRGVDHSAK